MKNTGYESTLVFLTMNHNKVLKALQSLNWQYGTGDIINYSAPLQFIRVKRQYGYVTYKFKVYHLLDGKTSIGLRGHRQRI